MLFTPVDLVHALQVSVTNYVKGMVFRDPENSAENAPLVPIVIYPFEVPSYQAAHSIEDVILLPKAPSVAVKLVNAEFERLDGWAEAFFQILTWDDNNLRRGAESTWSVINRIVKGLQKEQQIQRCFQLLDHPIACGAIEEPTVDFHPFYPGYVTARFGLWSAPPSRVTNPTWYDVSSDTMTINTAKTSGVQQVINVVDPTSNAAIPGDNAYANPEPPIDLDKLFG